MISTADFFKYFQWSGILTLAFAVLTILALVLKWGFKFRLVGATGFMGVLTAGLFALSLVPIVHTNVPGALHYSLIYDNGSDRATIAVRMPISETGLDATLRQAAADLYSYGRSGSIDKQLKVRARTVIHPRPGISEPLVLGEVTRSLGGGEDSQLEVKIDRDNLLKVARTNSLKA
ncbi:Ycf51 family protein [Chamaesiphon sp. VAR_48_metabat_403]|uniref:Ycf51 family protein n=1 Tax=Chamaesiphon sp. VAR_48_metabat_403 TaxID=2964700 RepID=UPI00286E0C60|nr:Ycf51 family protein [Chamaesiphon sp. VAR_48_metabat_403]